MTTSEVLRQARASIESRENWWDGHEERGNGRRLLCAAWAIWDLRSAERFCNPATDALIRVVADARDATERAIYTFNDTHSHAEVLAAFDQAIANEEAREQEFSVTACEPVKATA